MKMKAKIKQIIPEFILNNFRDLRDRISHEGKYDYKMKRGRSSPFDYTTRYDHTSLRKARKSILWDDDWHAATSATIAVMEDLNLLQDGQTIIDYGGGIGRITRAVLEKYESNLILVDRSPEMRDHALQYISEKPGEGDKLRIWSDIEFLNNIPAIEGQIDLIMFIEALQHIPEPILRELFSKILSCLSDEGRVFVLGNKDLDVDDEAKRHHTLIGDFLNKQSEVLREDVWMEWKSGGQNFRFKHPRFSFLCRKRSG